MRGRADLTIAGQADRGASALARWLERNGIGEVEYLFADLNGVLRGRVVSAAALMGASPAEPQRVASSALSVMLTGGYAAREADDEAYRDPDVVLQPDVDTLCLAPDCEISTAWMFSDACHAGGESWAASPRAVLRAALDRFHQRRWRPVIAPELEFYVAAPTDAPRLPATPYELDLRADLADFSAQLTRGAAVAGIELGRLVPEAGTGQLELNFTHGDPLARADQVLLCKRIVRQAGLDHGLTSTFMAKPFAGQAPSALHLHLSLSDAASGRNLFAEQGGALSGLLGNFIGGVQRWLPEATALLAPNVNSFRRLLPRHSAPVNVEWGRDNRSCGLRVPNSGPESRRLEVRLAGADANPYLAMAAVLICGQLGVEQQLAPAPEVTGNAYLRPRTLPATMEDALERLRKCRPVCDALGEHFVSTFLAVKHAELEAFQAVVTPWERELLFSRI
jgi:glutamine synthetase